MRRLWEDTVKTLQENNHQPRIFTQQNCFKKKQNNIIFSKKPEKLLLKELLEDLHGKDGGKSVRKACFTKGAKFSILTLFQLIFFSTNVFVRKIKLV